MRQNVMGKMRGRAVTMAIPATQSARAEWSVSGGVMKMFPPGPDKAKRYITEHNRETMLETGTDERTARMGASD